MPRQFVRLLNQPDPPNPLMDCYRPPPGKPEKARWVIPDIDYGLLGQFQSQKEKFKELEDINKILAKPRRAYKVRMEDITDEDYETNSKITMEERATMTKILNGTYAAQLDPPTEKLTARTLDKMTNQAYERRVVGLSTGGATVGSDQYNKIASGTQTIEQMMSARSARMDSSRSNNDSSHNNQHSARMQQNNNNNNNNNNNSARGFPQVTMKKLSKTNTLSKMNSLPTLQEVDGHGGGDLHDQKVSTFKTLGKEHPDILAKWRANRAGEFVVTQKHPLEPPTQRDMTERVFRPPGTVVPKALKEFKKGQSSSNNGTGTGGLGGGGVGGSSSSGNGLRIGGIGGPGSGLGGGGGGGDSTARMTQTLDALVGQLEKTEAEIERQKLKIALKKNTKHYQL